MATPITPETHLLTTRSDSGPLGLISQATIYARGEMVPKHRLTLDQSFEFQIGASINSQVRFDKLTPCQYGTALKRFVHCIVALRCRHPTTKTLLTKLDFKAAYRRLTPGPCYSHPVGCHTWRAGIPGTLADIWGAPCPSQWSDMSELTCDTCNQLSHCSTWNPTDTPLLQSPHQPHYVRTPKYLPSSIPCATASTMIVKIDAGDSPYTECYIDDLFTCFLDTPLRGGKEPVSPSLPYTY